MVIEAYPKIYNLGHRAIRDLSKVPVILEEKVDGSQFSFTKVDGELQFRSKGRAFVEGAEDKMFNLGVQAVRERFDMLQEGWVYRGEYLNKPKHNTLEYKVIPAGYVAIFDIQYPDGEFLTPFDKKVEAQRLDFSHVPYIVGGVVEDEKVLLEFLERESFLGGPTVEGVVLKPIDYDLYGIDGRVLMGKFVSEKFKEQNGKQWKQSNPTGRDILALLGETYRHENRWKKAVQHLRDEGRLEGSPKDIGPLIAEAKRDLLSEEVDEIKERLFKWASPHILRKSTAGLAEWYKEELLKEQFGGNDAS